MTRTDGGGRPLRFGCAILAGGKGSRFGGTDKARLTLEGRTYLERIAAELSGFDERLVAGGAPDLAASVGFRPVPDSVPGLGPLGGLRDALAACASDVLLVVPCDLPFFRRALADFLVRAWEAGSAGGEGIEGSGGDDALVVRDGDGRLQPLCGLYAKRCLDAVEARLARGERRVSDLAADVRVRAVDLPAELRGTPVLHNVNRPEDLP